MIRVKNRVYLVIIAFFVFSLSGMEDRRVLPLLLFNKMPFKSILGVVQTAGYITGGSLSLGEIDLKKHFTQLAEYIPGARLVSFLSEMNKNKKNEDDLRRRSASVGSCHTAYIEAILRGELNEQYEGIPQLFSNDEEKVEPSSTMLVDNSTENYEQENSGSSSGDITSEINLADVVQSVWQRRGRIEGQNNAEHKIGIHRERNKKVSDVVSLSPKIEDHERSKKPIHNNLNDQDDRVGPFSNAGLEEVGSSSANLTNNSPENDEQEDSGSSSGDIIPEIDLADVVQQGKQIMEKKESQISHLENEKQENQGHIVHQPSLPDAVPQEQRDETSPNIGVRTSCFTGLKNKCAAFLTYLKKLCGYECFTAVESIIYEQLDESFNIANNSECIRTKIKNMFLSLVSLSWVKRLFRS